MIRSEFNLNENVIKVNGTLPVICVELENLLREIRKSMDSKGVDGKGIVEEIYRQSLKSVEEICAEGKDIIKRVVKKNSGDGLAELMKKLYEDEWC